MSRLAFSLLSFGINLLIERWARRHDTPVPPANWEVLPFDFKVDWYLKNGPTRVIPPAKRTLPRKGVSR